MRDNTLVFWRFKKDAPCEWRRGLFKTSLTQGLVKLAVVDHPLVGPTDCILSEFEIEMVPMPDTDKEQGR